MKLIAPELVGSLHKEICHRMQTIFYTQFNKHISNGIKGFLLYGAPGTGKSTIAKRVIYDLNSRNGLDYDVPDDSLYILLNLAHIARSKIWRNRKYY